MDFPTLQSNLVNLIQNNKKIAVMISGGLDSGLLLYATVLTIKESGLDSDLSVITVPRYDDSIIHSRRVVNWANQKFQTNLPIIESGNPDLHHSLQTWSGVTSQIDNFDLILMGCTTNPPHLLNGPLRPKVQRRKVKQPLYDLTKQHTVRLVIDLNLIDLMTLSHTCTKSKLLRCGQCWQCRERAWGFEVNNYIDPGTM